MKLNIPIRYQQPDECGVACLEMVFNYLGKPFEIDEAIKTCSSMSPKAGDWYFRLGEFAMQKGLNSKIVTRTTRIFDASWFGIGQEQLINKLKQAYEYKKQAKADKWELNELQAAVSYLESDGVIIFDPISKQLIKSYLDAKVPIIAPVNANLIIKGLKRRVDDKPDDIKGSKVGHVVLVVGYEGDDFIINDPGGKCMNLTNEPVYNVDQDELVESVLRGDMHILCVW